MLILDRILPTHSPRVRDGGLSILIMNWRDPKHPQAGGAERYLLELSRQFVARHHHVHWLTAGFAGAPASDRIDGIEITRLGNRFTVYAAMPLAYLHRFRKNFDVIIDAENGVPFFSPLFSRKPTICLMFHVHQRVFEKHLPIPFSTIFKWIEARAMPAVYAGSRFVAISNDTKAELEALGVHAGRIDLAISGIDTDLRPGVKAERPTILYLGRLKKYKRVHLLIEALPEIRASLPDVELVIAGAGDTLPSLRALAQRSGVAEAVRFEGFVTDDRKRELMQEAWVFAMSSEMEGWGLTVIEANACGTPCVGFDVPGVGEAIVHAKTGWLVDDAEPIAPTITRLLLDDQLRAELASAGVLRALAFSWTATADAFLDVILREVLHRRKL